ncbi:MAG: translation elongation factor [Coleofasciculus chthonoplastes F3-SA18-01]|uniref:type II restriction enzyme n=1 Tax=Coleofasciculus chthonoplastes TaxID=64178 RepID=UPI0032F39CDD
MNNSQEKIEKTKNDVAWEKIFQDYSVLDRLSQDGFFEIDSVTINQFRESRLMAKFDHSINRPKIFKDNNLSILPVSRNTYKIGYFDAYLKVNYDSGSEPIEVEPTELETIDYTNLSSESSVLSCAFNTGIIADLLDDGEVHYTVSGRMSTGDFCFFINNTLNEDAYNMFVTNSQCEIDAGFESNNYFLIVEAKMGEVKDFLIRQLYYPYKLWSNKINKKVVPALITYSNSTSIFSCFIYEFTNNLSYNSIELVEKKDYIMTPERITSEDLSEVFKSIVLVPEPPGIPFPQANEFDRIVDLLSLLLDGELTKEEITVNYEFDARQTNYYTDAVRYLGLADKHRDPSTKEVIFHLTREGKDILTKRYKAKICSLIRKILEHEVFYKTFELTLGTGDIPKKNEVCKIMSDCGLDLNPTTIERRSSTVRGWIDWILKLTSDV